jgi:ATP-dependent Lon protease
VGGIKEKILAAHRAGIKRVILPERSVADLDEVPQEVRDDLEFVPVTKMDEVLLEALETPEKLDLKPRVKGKKAGGKDQVAESSVP